MNNQIKNLCTLYIVRHGETEWNVAKRIQGQTDSPLTDAGKKQAKELGKIFQDIHFDAVFSSDLLRAKRTAEIITMEKQLEVITTRVLRERAFGQFEGAQINELREIDKILEKFSDEEKFSRSGHPDIETDEKLIERFITFIREVGVGYAGKKVLVVTHGGILRALLIHLGFATYQTLQWGGIKNTAYIELDTDGVDFFIRNTHGISLATDEALS